MHAFLQSVFLFVYANDEGFKQVKGVKIYMYSSLFFGHMWADCNVT